MPKPGSNNGMNEPSLVSSKNDDPRGAWATGKLTTKPETASSPTPSTSVDVTATSPMAVSPSLSSYTTRIFEISLQNFRGEVVMVQTTDGSIYEGVFDEPVVDHTNFSYKFLLRWVQQQPQSRVKEFTTPIRVSSLLKSTHPFEDVREFASAGITAIRAPGFAPSHTNVAFATDTQISGHKATGERELTKWDVSEFSSSGALETGTSLGDMIRDSKSTKWDQFSVNAKLAPVMKFDMNRYSTKIDTSDKDYRRHVAEAHRIAQQIERGITTDKVLLRDRRAVEMGESDDEDDMFSTVLGRDGKQVRIRKPKPAEPAKEGIYVPPAKRSAEDQRRMNEERDRKEAEAEAEAKAKAEADAEAEAKAKAKADAEAKAEAEAEAKAKADAEAPKEKSKLSVKAAEFKPSASAPIFVPFGAPPPFQQEAFAPPPHGPPSPLSPPMMPPHPHAAYPMPQFAAPLLQQPHQQPHQQHLLLQHQHQYPHYPVGAPNYTMLREQSTPPPACAAPSAAAPKEEPKEEPKPKVAEPAKPVTVKEEPKPKTLVPVAEAAKPTPKEEPKPKVAQPEPAKPDATKEEPKPKAPEPSKEESKPIAKLSITAAEFKPSGFTRGSSGSSPAPPLYHSPYTAHHPHVRHGGPHGIPDPRMVMPVPMAYPPGPGYGHPGMVPPMHTHMHAMSPYPISAGHSPGPSPVPAPGPAPSPSPSVSPPPPHHQRKSSAPSPVALQPQQLPPGGYPYNHHLAPATMAYPPPQQQPAPHHAYAAPAPQHSSAPSTPGAPRPPSQGRSTGPRSVHAHASTPATASAPPARQVQPQAQSFASPRPARGSAPHQAPPRVSGPSPSPSHGGPQHGRNGSGRSHPAGSPEGKKKGPSRPRDDK